MKKRHKLKLIHHIASLAVITSGVAVAESPGAALTCIAHRGFSSAYPENTVEAIRAASAAGADIVEVDVRILPDATLVLFHDGEISGQHLNALSFDALQRLTKDYTVPTLQQGLDACPEGRILLLDLKGTSPEFVDALVRVLQKPENAKTELQLQSREAKVLSRLSRKIERPTLIYLSSLKREGPRKTPPSADALSALLVKNSFHGISVKGREFIDAKFVKTFRDKGLMFNVWTVNDADRMRHYRSLGVGGIITDHPDVLSQMLKGSCRGDEAEQGSRPRPD